MDIYFEPNYGKLYEKAECGTCELFEYSGPDGTVSNLFIKREIPFKADGHAYYDLVTPYGYGGPLIRRCDGDRSKLVREYAEALQTYCRRNHIVSEFVRFHPVLGNAADFSDCYETVHIRNTVGTDLHKYDDPIREEFSRSCRKNIRSALNRGITFQIVEKPDDMREFQTIYYDTMDRNGAAGYYYFDDDYFTRCVRLLGDRILFARAIYEGQTIAMGLYFVWDKMIHAHLSGTLNQYLHLSPAYILRYAVTLWGKEHGYDLFHHGGGRSNHPEDSLYLFKRQFGRHTEFEYHVGKKIWNAKAYRNLCAVSGGGRGENFFPAYRTGMWGKETGRLKA